MFFKLNCPLMKIKAKFHLKYKSNIYFFYHANKNVYDFANKPQVIVMEKSTLVGLLKCPYKYYK